MAEEFNQKTYWIDRHQNHQGDPRSVGTFALSVAENLEGERELQRIMTTLAAELAKTLDRPSVMDLGCGYGRVAKQFHDNGFEYLGIDVSPVAVARAQTEHPNVEFEVRDLLTWTPEQKFDVVCALFVLVHFVDDEAWRRMLLNAVACVKPGGYFVLADDFPEIQKSAAHYVARPYSLYDGQFVERGFELDHAVSAALRKAEPTSTQVGMFRILRKVRS